MSPVYGSVAKKPSSAPVRRMYPAISGVRRSTSSTRRITLSVWASEVPTGML